MTTRARSRRSRDAPKSSTTQDLQAGTRRSGALLGAVHLRAELEELVAQEGGPLEVELGGGVAHLVLQLAQELLGGLPRRPVGAPRLRHLGERLLRGARVRHAGGELDL